MSESIKLNSTGMHCIGAYMAKPQGTPKGGIVVVQEIFGVNAHIRSLVDGFAEAGYTAIAPAFFDHVENDVELDYDAEGIARGRTLSGALDIDQVMADVGSAADSIQSAGKIGVVGYCWGGSIALLSASRLGLPGVSYYGARNVAWLHERFTAPLQFHFGEKDRSIPPAAIERHRECLADAEIYLYPAGHGFNCDLRKDFAPKSAALARERTLAFFEKNLGRSNEA